MFINYPKKATIEFADYLINNHILAHNATESIVFNLEETSFIDPFGLTVIAGTIMQIIHKQTKGLSYTPPKDVRLLKYLSQIGFNSLFQFNDVTLRRETSVELKQLNALQPLFVDDLILLIDRQMTLSIAVKDSLKMSLLEVLTNVFDHSQSEEGCFVCAQYYPNLKLIRLCITDFGVGILATLKDKYKAKNDVEAITLSVKEGVTSRSMNAGLGLAHIRNFLKVNEGRLTILSGSGMVTFYSHEVYSKVLNKPFKGTAVDLEINADREGLYFINQEDYIF